MRNGSWMTAWAFVAAFGLATLAAPAITPADDKVASDKDKDKEKAKGIEEDDTPRVVGTVRLEIQISGIGSDGAKVSIKPAHPGCQFKTIEKTIAKGPNSGEIRLSPITVPAFTTAADRDCSFLITVTEPGRSPRTFRRGLQLSASEPDPGQPPRPQRLKCALSATNVSARDDSKTAKTATTDTTTKTRR